MAAWALHTNRRRRKLAYRLVRLLRSLLRKGQWHRHSVAPLSVALVVCFTSSFTVPLRTLCPWSSGSARRPFIRSSNISLVGGPVTISYVDGGKRETVAVSQGASTLNNQEERALHSYMLNQQARLLCLLCYLRRRFGTGLQVHQEDSLKRKSLAPSAFAQSPPTDLQSTGTNPIDGDHAVQDAPPRFRRRRGWPADLRDPS